MDTLEIHSKDFLIKWISAPENSVIDWQVKPLKKSINFALYQKRDDADSQPSSTSDFADSAGLSDSTPTNARLRANSTATVNQFTKSNDVYKSKSRTSTLSTIGESNLDLIKNYHKLVANELVHGKYEAPNGGMFAFVFDNSFSKTIAKSVEFSAEILLDKPAPQQHEQYVFDGTQNGHEAAQPGKVLQSVMLKKRRKKMQGFTKRYFVLNFKRGTLSYFQVNDNKLRGQMPIKDAIISANQHSREFIIDSGMEVWHLKTVNVADFNAWVNAFNAVKKEDVSPQGEPTSGLGAGAGAATGAGAAAGGVSAAALAVIAQKLSKLQAENPSPLVDDINRDMETLLAKSRGEAPASKSADSQSIHSSEFHDAEDHFDEDGVVFLDDGASPSQADEVEDQVDENSSDDEEEDDNNFYGKDGASAGAALGAGVGVGASAGAGADADAGAAALQGQPPQDGASTPASTEDDLYPLPHADVKRNPDVPICTHTPPSLLSFVRKNVGKDLSTIAMPVTYNEPTTVLQKFAEMLEYPDIATNALGSDFQDESGEKLLRIAAFALSSLSSSRAKERNKRKPFTPLLGETYELVREDLGFRLVSEKVSHRPPVFAYHVDTETWTMDFAVSPSQKFWGKQSEITTKGVVVLKDKATGEEFSWTQATQMLKNIIAGETYAEPTGNVTIKSSNGYKAVAEFSKGGMWSGRSEGVEIKVFDNKKKELPYTVSGNWTEKFTLKTSSTEKTIWQAGELLPNYQKKYGFTTFAGTLNKITEMEQGQIPPTDSRNRPDLQAYEKGDVDTAENLKNKLEQDQRVRRKQTEDAGQQHTPAFFKFAGNGPVDEGKWEFIQGPASYWNRRKNQDWSGLTPLW
ncbi:uncharacterized protein LODBEIA_P51440 [Lodderomyces beijingensis]|uniref:PH domain-containing protein n=1 Tax=Lodderomyces beijingensis TaxID=1775926 RepID=A0ABP0ZW71_9ASCO